MSSDIEVGGFPINTKTIIPAAIFLFLIGYGLASVTGLTGSCQLMHESVSPSSEFEPVETYEYEELSDDAKQMVDESVEDGGYWTKGWGSNPPEFRYGNDTTAYDINHQGNTYRILTYERC